MGGGSGGGGGISSSDMAKLQQAADERLKSLASNSAQILFACEAVDRKALDARLAGSSVFKKDRIAIVDSSQQAAADALLTSSTFLVLFTNADTDAKFLDVMI